MEARGARRCRITPLRRTVRALGAGIPTHDAPQGATGAHAGGTQDALPALDSGACAAAGGGAPAGQRISHAQHAAVAVDERDADGRPQERGVDGGAAVDPQRLLAMEVRGAEEADEPSEGMVREVAARRDGAAVRDQRQRRRVEPVDAEASHAATVARAAVTACARMCRKAPRGVVAAVSDCDPTMAGIPPGVYSSDSLLGR